MALLLASVLLTLLGAGSSPIESPQITIRPLALAEISARAHWLAAGAEVGEADVEVEESEAGPSEGDAKPPPHLLLAWSSGWPPRTHPEGNQRRRFWTELTPLPTRPFDVRRERGPPRS